MPKKQSNTKQSAVKLQEAPAVRPVPAEAAATETADHEYALVSVLYHALQGVQAGEQYIKDAERAGDDELVKFFEESRDEQAARANRAKSLLSSRMDNDDDEDSDDDEEDDDEEGDDEEE